MKQAGMERLQMTVSSARQWRKWGILETKRKEADYMAKATREAYGEALKKLAAANPDIVVLDADLSGSTKTAEFNKVSPERFFNVGIAEQNLIGTAAGLSLAGKIPFASSFAMFATGRAFEIVRNTVA